MQLLNNYIKFLLDKPENIFIFVALVFGFIFMLLTPPMEYPNENGHFLKSCEVAQGILFSKKVEQRTIYEIKTDNIVVSKRYINGPNYISGYSPTMYFMSALGLKVSNFLTDNPNVIFYSGRVLNLLLYSFLIYFAIKITPVFKYPFLYAALFPISVWLAGSYSADVFNIGFSFLYFAYLFKLIFGNKELTNKDLLIILLLSLIGASAKGTIYPLVLLFFLPPIAGNKKIKKYFCITFIVLSSILLCSYLRLNNYVFYNPMVENFPSNHYVLTHLKEVIWKILYTTKVMFGSYIEMSVGVFGYLKLKYFAKWFCYLYFGLFLGSLFVFGEKIDLKLRLTAIFTYILVHVCILMIYFYIWTDLSNPVIEGIQGRYYIPAFPLLMLIFSNRLIKFPQKYNHIYIYIYIVKAFITIFLILVLTYVAVRLHQSYVIEHVRTYYI